MNLRILTAVAAIPAIATVAYAQTTTTPTTEPPSATTTITPSTSTGGVSAPEWYQRQQGELRSSKLIGSKVKNTAGDSIGDINEIVLMPDGSAAAAIIGVGGFLGMGEREVAVQFKSLKIARDSSGNDVVTLDATKDSLKNAPAWTWQSS